MNWLCTYEVSYPLLGRYYRLRATLIAADRQQAFKRLQIDDTIWYSGRLIEARPIIAPKTPFGKIVFASELYVPPQS